MAVKEQDGKPKSKEAIKIVGVDGEEIITKDYNTIISDNKKEEETILKEQYIDSFIDSQYFLAYAKSKLKQLEEGGLGVVERCDGRKKTTSEVFWEAQKLRRGYKNSIIVFNNAKKKLKEKFYYDDKKFKVLERDAGIIGG